MDKWKLIEITLEQLVRQWEHNKDLFLTDKDQSMDSISNKNELFVSWEPPKEPDPERQQLALVSKNVRITYSLKGKYFKCEITNRGRLPNKPENFIIASKSFIPIRSLYWDFMRLRKKIAEHRKNRENSMYLENLYNVFPGTLDDLILGDGDED